MPSTPESRSMMSQGAYGLGLSFDQNSTLYTTSIDTGQVTAAGVGKLVVEPNPNDVGDAPELSTVGVEVADGATLAVGAPDTTAGGIYLPGAGTIDHPPSSLSVGTGTAPDGTLNVTGDVTMSSGNTLVMYIDQSASTPPTPTPSTDYSQLTASDTVNLDNEPLQLTLGDDSAGTCEDLVPGQVYTLISAGTINGEFSGIADGSTIQMSQFCGIEALEDSRYDPTVEINYNTSTTPETVTATVVSGGHAADVPGGNPVPTISLRRRPSGPR